MSKFSILLPEVKNITINSILKNPNETYKNVDLGYNKIIDDTKDKITKIDKNTWEKFKKHFNDYEFPVKYRYISRGFFKLQEILVDYNLNINCESLHLAESPGGFIEACIGYKNEKYSSIKTCHTMSKISPDSNIPNYHKKIINNSNVKIYKGITGDGDIYRLENIIYLMKNIKNVLFITADGGIPVNEDFDIKEQIHYKLIYSQLLTIILILENNGSCVIKFFDSITELTVDMIYLMCFLFDKVYINKPYTSRTTNSEKYLVCLGYKKELLNIQLKNYLVKIFDNIECYRSLFIKEPSFVEYIKKCNISIYKTQLKEIDKILNAIEIGKQIKLYNNSNNNKLIKSWISKYSSS